MSARPATSGDDPASPAAPGPGNIDASRPRFVSHAQNFEDVMLWRALGHVVDGFYVDVGAQDPVLDSVSKAFYERGWTGIDIEPVAEYAAALRADRPRNRVLECAIAEKTGQEPLFVFDDTGLSTLHAGQAERNRRQLGLAYSPRQVRVRPLRDVLAELGDREIHWLKIDVEGAEEEVLRSWQGSPARPWIVVVEATRPNEPVAAHHGWEDILTDAGYAFAWFDGLNRFYVAPGHAELQAAFRVPPNVFDHFTLASIERMKGSFAHAERYARSLEAEIEQQVAGLRIELQSQRELASRRAEEVAECSAYAATLGREIDGKDRELRRAGSALNEAHERERRHADAMQSVFDSRDAAATYARSLEGEVAALNEVVRSTEREAELRREALEAATEGATRQVAEWTARFTDVEAYARSLKTHLQAERDRVAALEQEAADERRNGEKERETAEEALHDAETRAAVSEATGRRLSDAVATLEATVARWRTDCRAQVERWSEQTRKLAHAIGRPVERTSAETADGADDDACRARWQDEVRAQHAHLVAEVECIARELERHERRWFNRLSRLSRRSS